MLVEFQERDVALEELLSVVGDFELPALPGEDDPAHPLDPHPLVVSAGRLAGSLLGLGLLAARRASGRAGPPASGTAPADVAAVISILEGLPGTRSAVREVCGRVGSELVFGGANIVVLTLAGSPLGLAVMAVGALRLLTEVHARREVWRRFAGELVAADAGGRLRIAAGERTHLRAKVLAGAGAAIDPDGILRPVAPGDVVPAGSRLSGAVFLLEPTERRGFQPTPRPVPPSPTPTERYLRLANALSLGYAALTAIATRSVRRTLVGLLLVSPRPALIGVAAANLSASARVLRDGVIVVGTRRHRVVRRPDVLLLDGAGVLVDDLEVATVEPGAGWTSEQVARVAADVVAASGSQWRHVFAPERFVPAPAEPGAAVPARAWVEGAFFTVEPAFEQRRDALLLRQEGVSTPVGVLTLRPRVSPAAAELTRSAERHGVRLAIVNAELAGEPNEISVRTGIEVHPMGDLAAAVRGEQADARRVAVLSSRDDAAAAFDACDLGIGLAGERAAFPARADLLVRDLGATASVLDVGARRGRADRDATLFAVAANAGGMVIGLRSRPMLVEASRGIHIAALGAMLDGWLRLRGRAASTGSPGLSRLVEPQPERWGAQSIETVLDAFGTSPRGLTSGDAQRRRKVAPPQSRHALLSATAAQLRSPLTTMLAAGAGLSLVLGVAADAGLIGAVIAANSLVSAWQEREAGRATEALAGLARPLARVVRDGRVTSVPSSAVVAGDVLVLGPGDHVPADARLLDTSGLEVDEAALTGESFPVSKASDALKPEDAVVLEGSDVVVGTGRAVVVAVGADTRLGATAAVLAAQGAPPSQLGARLQTMLGELLPAVVIGGAAVAVSGMLRRRPALPQLALGASAAIAAVPEGLPLLAGVAEAAVARRLASRNALVKRLAAIEALGRVDVACVDKTGTLTTGQLRVTLLADLDGEAPVDPTTGPPFRHVLGVAAMATPRADGVEGTLRPTDAAIIAGARHAGIEDAGVLPRRAESFFDPSKPFHATVVGSRLCVKGAAEALVERCGSVRRSGGDVPLDASGRGLLLGRAEELARRGLRVLLVAEGKPDGTSDDPKDLVALGFVGITDPLRPGVPDAVRRCQQAGVRVVLLTGDHAATATTIAAEAGIASNGDVVTGDLLRDLDDDELADRLQRVAVLARVTPLDKLRIVQSLQRRGHTVAMTGDGINDAPALRLADVGVAMGKGGTDVAREAADVVLADDDFATLVEALVEGRGFWRNIRQALALLLGGNLGELAVMTAGSVFAPEPALTTRLVLMTNLVTDVLPAVALAVQPPEHRDLSGLAREGTAALQAPLRRQILRRAVATAVPTLVSFGASLPAGAARAQSVAFTTLVSTQLAQTLQAGWSERRLDRAVVGAVGASGAVLLAAHLVSPLRGFLELSPPGTSGAALIATGTIEAVAIAHGLDRGRQSAA